MKVPLKKAFYYKDKIRAWIMVNFEYNKNITTVIVIVKNFERILHKDYHNHWYIMILRSSYVFAICEIFHKKFSK